MNIEDVDRAVKELGDLYRILEEKKRHLDEQSIEVESSFKVLEDYSRSKLQDLCSEVGYCFVVPEGGPWCTAIRRREGNTCITHIEHLPHTTYIYIY